MKKIIVLTALLSLISGCSTTADPTYTASGKPGYRLICGGVFGNGDLGGCYEKAGQLCTNQGYRTLQTSVSSMIIECRDGNSDDVVAPQ